MRKIFLLLVVAILFIVNLSIAQTSRDGTSSEGKTTFTNISVVGLKKDGTEGRINPGLPGYIEMVSTEGKTFYLYVGADERLHFASEIAVGVGASPSINSWADASGEIIQSRP